MKGHVLFLGSGISFSLGLLGAFLVPSANDLWAAYIGNSLTLLWMGFASLN